MNAHNEQQSIIAGALFDLMGYLTCREKKLHLSASDDAAPAVEALTEWAEERGFDLDKARVTDWQAALAAQPSPVVKQNLTTQPAAAQEAVAWLSKDEAQLALFKAIQAIRFGNPTDDKMILDNLRHEGLWIGRYANAPVTAAPEASYFEYLDRYNHSLRRAIHAMMAKLVFLLDEDQFADIEAIALAAGVTPAAPGIDLEPFRRLVEWNYDSEFAAYEHGHRTEEQREEAEAERTRLLALIDASSKGVSEAVSVKRNCAPPSWMFPEDGGATTEWRAKAAAWIEEQAVEQEHTNAAYPAHVAAYPSWADRVHWLRTLAAKVAQAQAGDAEVQP